MENYLLQNHKEDIIDLLNDDNDKSHVAISVDLIVLKEKQPILFTNVIKQVVKVSLDWNNALLIVQKKIVEDGNAFLELDFQIKENCHVRFVNLPSTDNPLINQNFPSIDNVGSFVQVKGTITRISQERLLEYKREYVCNKCKESVLIKAEYGRMYIFDVPKYCISRNGICRGTLKQKNPMPLPNCLMDYQEIHLQEMFSKKRHRLSLIICMENDLVDACVPGECVTVCGTIEYQRRPLIENKYGEVIITMHAVGIIKDKKRVNINKDFAEKMIFIRGQWEDDCNKIGQINARDLIIQSICPEVFGLYPIKLALALALCSGIKDEQNSNGISSGKRGNSHILLIGDPGLAKSVLLKSVADISIRSVHTTGLGCSAAGLTAAAVRDQGEWHLEAGALVLADGGVCCIDEFNLMQEHDKGALHEAMEQQTVSIAKAGIVSTLNTRCVILAATNARCLYTMSDPEGLSSLNIGIATPLLSRFDLIFILRDERNPDWDNRIAMHLLNKKSKTIENNYNNKLWNLERLQSHFLAAHEIKSILTTEAHLILCNYYKMCRSDTYGDVSRTTVRLLDSIIRLSQSHARLMLRSEVLGIDAIIVVLLMESTLGFGRLLTPLNVVKQELPLGPNSNDITKVLNVLELSNLEEKLLEQLKSFKENNLKIASIWNKNKEDVDSEIKEVKKRKLDKIDIENKETLYNDNQINIKDFERIFGFKNQIKKPKITNKEHKNILGSSKNILNNNSETLKDSQAEIVEDELKNFDIQFQKNLENNNNTFSSTDNDLIDWDDNEFEINNELLEMSNNSQKVDNVFKKTKSLNTVSKNNEKLTIDFNSIFDDANLDDLDLELDSLEPKKKNSKKDYQTKINETKLFTNVTEKRDETKINSKHLNEKLRICDKSKATVVECFKNNSIEVSSITLQKLNNFVNPLQIEKNNDSETSSAKGMQSNNKDNETVNIYSQSSINSLATQYENLDFLDFN